MNFRFWDLSFGVFVCGICRLTSLDIHGMSPYLPIGPMQLKIVPDVPLLTDIKAHAHDVINMIWQQRLGQQLALVLHFPRLNHVGWKVLLFSFWISFKCWIWELSIHLPSTHMLLIDEIMIAWLALVNYKLTFSEIEHSWFPWFSGSITGVKITNRS